VTSGGRQGKRHEEKNQRPYPLRYALCALRVRKAQQPKKLPRIGLVSVSGDASNPGRNVEVFRQGLRDLGYIEGKNILVEYRYAAEKPDRVPGFVAELVQLKVDVLVSSATAGIETRVNFFAAKASIGLS
jgi:hypothetical protein